MTKQYLLAVLCVGLLTLSACSKENEQKGTQAVETTAVTAEASTPNEVQAVTQVAENTEVESELARTEPAAEQKA